VSDAFKAIVYGIVEGITEWLPVSSTGHLILLGDLLSFSCLDKRLSDILSVTVQLFAVLAVVVAYPKRLLPIGERDQRKSVYALWWRMLLCTLPAALIGLGAELLCRALLGRELDALLFTPTTVACALIVYGILFILAERMLKNTRGGAQITPLRAFCIGLFQALAMIPGTSRSGATILGARILGASREESAEFSFFAAIPVIGAATLLKSGELFSLIRGGLTLSGEAIAVFLISAVVTFVLSVVTVRALTGLVRRHSFIPFGIYRIALGALILFII